MVPREIKDNALAKFGGANKLYYGRFATGEEGSLMVKLSFPPRSTTNKAKFLSRSTPIFYFKKNLLDEAIFKALSINPS